MASQQSPVALEGHWSGTKGNSELLALTDPQKETKLKTFLYPTMFTTSSLPDTRLCCSRQGAHTLTEVQLTGDPESC